MIYALVTIAFASFFFLILNGNFIENHSHNFLMQYKYFKIFIRYKIRYSFIKIINYFFLQCEVLETSIYFL